jgi:putative zinc finger/helix-turn-helix YgiT family protein
MEHDGRAYAISVPQLEILECQKCKTRVLPDEAHGKLVDALRIAAGLLTPAEIRERRKQLGLTQEQLANFLRVAKETVSRWETGGQIQQRAMDLLLRAFFDVPELREYLQQPVPPSRRDATRVPASNVTIAAVCHPDRIQQSGEMYTSIGHQLGSPVPVGN